MTSQKEWRRIEHEIRVGESGNNSMGTTHNYKGYQTYLAKKKQAAEYPAVPVYTPPPPYWTSASSPSVPASPSLPFPVGGDLGLYRPYKRTWLDDFGDFLDLLWTGLKVTAVALLAILGLFVLYGSIGPEGFDRIGLYLALGGLACLAIWLLYRVAKWFFQTKAGKFVTLILHITAYAGLAIVIASIAWVVAKSLGYV